jgi:plastocyanin
MTAHRLRFTLALAVLAATLGSGWLLMSPPAHAGAAVTGTVTFVNAKGEKIVPEEKAVVYVRGVPNALPDTSKMVSSVKQKDKQFAPGFIVALKGSTVEFPNDDRIDHNVFSLSKAARFDLGLYRSGTTKSVVMKRAGLVDVYCNIHPEMTGKILVLETQYYAIAEKSGRFSIPSLPDGNYEIVAWQPYGEEQVAQVKIQDGSGRPVHLQLLRGEASKRHTRKDGTPYGRYQ